MKPHFQGESLTAEKVDNLGAPREDLLMPTARRAMSNGRDPSEPGTKAQVGSGNSEAQIRT